MSVYEEILNFEQELRAKYKQKFLEESELACELFNIFFEANDIHLEQWQSKPERRETLELINRIFNDLHAVLKLILEGMSVQGVALLRDTIECANHIKLFEVDSEFRGKWCRGEVFFPRDIQKRMEKLDIQPPSLNEDYKPLSQAYVHPSKVGVASHTLNWYPSPGKHVVKYLYGGVENVYQTRSDVLLALTFIYRLTYFIWVEMYTVDKDTHSRWHERLVEARKRIGLLQAKVKQEQPNYHIEQWATVRKILDDYFKLLQ